MAQALRIAFDVDVGMLEPLLACLEGCSADLAQNLCFVSMSKGQKCGSAIKSLQKVFGMELFAYFA